MLNCSRLMPRGKAIHPSSSSRPMTIVSNAAVEPTVLQKKWHGIEAHRREGPLVHVH